MSHKRVRSSSIKEVVFATKVPETNKILTLCRCFITREDAATYFNMFKYLEEVIKKKAGQDILWRHLHGTGWHTVTMDMDMAQAKGINY
ncbi:hypothetical protein EYZ11_013204 [Aspergillus tanneri]|uniref:Uncharacterized protein n=1 Tax=Aspergillus tanneri TaxID=1220188 RepID=A0A4S3IYR9_9EURO|nr:hypothetical protein EYZ11_013204 [Aspergillus tanneri]